MHRGFRVGTLVRKILRLWLRMTCRGCGGCFITMTGLEVPCVWSERRGFRERGAGARPPPCRTGFDSVPGIGQGTRGAGFGSAPGVRQSTRRTGVSLVKLRKRAR